MTNEQLANEYIRGAGLLMPAERAAIEQFAYWLDRRAPEPLPVDPNGPPHELRPLLENALKALDADVPISPGSYVHDELKRLLSNETPQKSGVSRGEV